MRFAVVLMAAALTAAPAGAESGRLQWPLRPAAAVTRGFDAPAPNWTRGHRGVDLAGSTGQPVFASAGGIVVFAGELAGRPLVSVQHPGGLRTSYEPVRPAVRAGQRVDTGTALGVLLDGHAGCPVRACLHWGAMWGPASRADYVDPLALLMSTPIVLKPVDAPDRAPHAAAPP
jgi:murein DD-endopeptidase MepM/ murein hydrolase activator NlpD